MVQKADCKALKQLAPEICSYFFLFNIYTYDLPGTIFRMLLHFVGCKNLRFFGDNVKNAYSLSKISAET